MTREEKVQKILSEERDSVFSDPDIAAENFCELLRHGYRGLDGMTDDELDEELANYEED